MTEIYYAPTKQAKPITLVQLQQHLTAVGMPCTVEKESANTHWLVFETHEATIYASTTGEFVTLATFEFSMTDDTKVGDTIELVMNAIDFSADEEADYA